MLEKKSSSLDSVTYPINESDQLKKPRGLVQKIFPSGFKEEFIEVFKLACPTTLTQLSQIFLQTISVIMSGHFDKHELDAAGLANSMINVFGIAIGMGMSTACDTFFSQAFGGEEKWRVGIYLQRSLIIMNCMALLICCIHINMLPILIFIGQNVEIAKLTADYLLYFCPGIFFDYNFLIVTRYLQTQNIVYPSLICSAIGNVVNIVSQYVCIHVLEYSYLASAVCQASSLGVMMVIQLIYIKISKVYKTTWAGFVCNEAVRGWGMFFTLAIPGLFMVCLEEWSFEIATLVAGSIDPVELGIQTIVYHVEANMYMFPLGVSIAISIRVGQHLGGGRPEHAKTAHRVGLALILITTTAMAIILILLRDNIPLLFTNDESIAHGASLVLILIAGFLYCDAIAGASGGALKGSGRQLTGAIILFIGYYMISLPIGISLALETDLKVFGLWSGLLVGIGIEAIIFIIIVGRTNWEHYCEQAALVACGNEEQHAEFALDLSCCGSSLTENITPRKFFEIDPLLWLEKQPRSRSTSYSREGDLSTSARPEETVNRVTEEPLRRVLIKRAIFALFIVTWVTAAVILRIFQQTPCFPVNNSTMPHYAGILPLCDHQTSS